MFLDYFIQYRIVSYLSRLHSTKLGINIYLYSIFFNIFCLVRLFTMGRNKNISCQKCFRVMRRDNLKTHMKQHEDGKFDKDSFCGSSLNTSTTSLDTDYKTDSGFSTTLGHYEIASIKEEEIIKILKKDAEEYKYKLSHGKVLYENVYKHNIPEESLRPEFKEMLDLYRKQRTYIDIDNVILRFWQARLEEYMRPCYREIIWIIGKNGNEGKTWFQEYIESKYGGWSKVISGMDIKMKKSSICHALSKRSLMTTDIFLFDVGKANTDVGVNYEVLENIKNGKTIASKYDTKELKFRTPNIVAVFSNEGPHLKALVKDRWKIFHIKSGDLVDVTKKYV